MDKKTILLTNDDGIEAEGLYRLYREIREDDQFKVVVIAPDKERSAVGHAITVFSPIPVWEETRDGKFFGYAVDGTPADCVKLAVKAILGKKPDLVISGINKGANIGENVIYSGTVSAATEGTVYDIPSMAISVDNLKESGLQVCCRICRKMAKMIISRGGLPGKYCLNINLPDLPEKQIEGVRVTCRSTAKFNDFLIKKPIPGAEIITGWMAREFVQMCENESDDYCAIQENGYISITPVHYDMTDYSRIDYFKNWGMRETIMNYRKKEFVNDLKVGCQH
ncbi:MAG: 5'/3'-nucleotidase SurE [Actinomycetota bacterium]|nr:5'/3'-nucleotidase SurE [Actinomycetota bacterium]